MKPNRNANPFLRTLTLGLAAALVMAFNSQSAKAANYYWDTTTTGTWQTGANWSTAATGSPAGTVVPTSADVAVFNGSAVNGAAIVQLSAPASIAGIVFANTGTTLLDSSSATSQALTIGTGGITINTGAGAVTIGDATNLAPITLGGAQSWTNNSASLFTVINNVTTGGNLLTVAGSGSTTVNGVIGSGAGGLTKTGAGTLTLKGANTYTGATTLNLGTLDLGGSSSTGAIPSGSALALGGGNLLYSRTGTNSQTFNNTSLAGGQSAVRNTSATNSIVLGSVTRTSGSGATVDFTATGVINTSTSNDATGILGGWATTGNFTTSATTGDWAKVDGSGNIGSYTGYTLSNPTGNNPTLNYKGSAGTITAVAGLVTVNSWLVNGGDVTIPAATTVVLNSGGFMFAQTASKWLRAGDATTSVITSGLATGELFVHTPNAAATDFQMLVRVSDNGTPLKFIKDGPGYVNLINVNNNYTGGTIVNGGTMVGGGANSLGTGAVRVYAGLLHIKASQSYSGGSFVNGGELRATEPLVGTVGNLSTGTVTVSTGGLLHFVPNNGAGTGSIYNYAQNFVLDGGTVLGDDAVHHIGTGAGNTINVTGNGGILQSQWNNKTLYVDGQLTGSGPLSVQDTGTGESSQVRITNNTNTYSGTITVLATSGRSSELFIDANNALQFATVSVSGTSVNNASGLGFTTTAPVFGALSGTGNFALTTGVTLSAGGNNSSTTYSGVMSGAGALTKAGNGTLTLTGINTYTGATSISAGGTLQLGDGTTDGSITPSSGITNDGTLAFNVAGTSAGANAVVGAGAVTKTGAGTATLTGTSTYAGVTTVNGGKLAVNGSIISNVTLNSGTICGTGVLSGTTTVANSSSNTIQNGTGVPGTQITFGNLTFNGAGTLDLKIDDTLTVPVVTTNFAVNAAGTVAVNVTKANPIWSVGNYPLVSYTGGTFTGGIGQLSAGAVPGLSGRQSASITNDTVNQVVNLHISGDVPIWTGSASSDWTTSTIASPKNWILQTAATPTDFQTLDAVLFNDSADTGSNPAAFSLNIAGASVNTTSTTFDNSINDYTVSSAGGFGISGGFLVKTGYAALTLATANTYAGGTTANDGTLNLNNASAIGTGGLVIGPSGYVTLDNTSGSAKTLATNNAQYWNGDFTFGGTNDLNLGTGAVVMSASRYITTNGAATLGVGGVISGTGFGLTKTGNGTLALAGANTYTGATIILSGNLVVTGAINNANTANVGRITVAGSSSANAGLTVAGGSVKATYATSPSLGVATTSGSRGFVNMTSGSITTAAEMHLGEGLGGSAHLSMSGGTLTVGSWLVVGYAGDSAIVNQSGGSVVISTNRMTIAAGANTSKATYNLSGGTFTDAGGIYIGEVGNGILNISGSASMTLGANARLANSTGSLGEINLLGGNLTTASVSNGPGVGTLNLNGGTLQANAASTTFVAGLTGGAYIYGGNANLNDGGFAITIPQALLAPSGSGVSAIAVTDGGAGYVDTPLVTLSGGTGSGAAAVANLSGGVVTGFTIVNPGSGYSGSDVLTATLTGGGASTPATVGAISLSANTSGGLVKSGTGTTTLAGVNTYSGATTVNAGTLALTGACSLATSGITVNGGAKFILASSAPLSAPITVSSGTFDGSGAAGNVTIASSASNVFSNGNGGSTGVAMGDLTFSGAARLSLKPATTSAVIATTSLTTGAGTITVDASRPSWEAGTYNLISYPGAIGGSGFSSFALGTITGLTARQAGSAVLSNPSGNVALTVGQGAIIWTGLVSGGAWTTTPATAQNWSYNAAPTDYLTTDAVLFDDSAAGTTTVDITDAANVSPLSTTFNNSSLTFTLGSSAGKGISGTGFLTKNGNGTVVIANGGLNTYTGATTLNNGVFSISNVANGGLASDLGASTNAAANLVFGGGTLRYTNTAPQSTDRAFTITPGATATFDITNAATGNLTVSGAGAATNGSLVKIGGGKLTLSGQNLYTGGTTVNNGTLVLNTGGTAGAIRGTLTINPGALVSLTAGNALGYSLNTKVDTVNINGGTLTSNGGDQGWNINYYLTAGTMATTGGNYTLGILAGGSTSVNSLASASSSVISGALWLRGDNAQTAVAFNAANGIADVDLLVSGNIGGDTGVGVNLTGPGKVVFSGTNSYKGATNVNSGTLVISGNSVGAIGAVNVASGATLGGSGNIGGSVTIASGGHQAISVAAGVTRTISGSLTLTSGNILDLTASSTPAVGSYTLVTATGGISGTPTTINYNGLPGTVTVMGNSMVLTVAAGYDAWATLKGLTAGVNDGPLQDPDNDGISNLMEYVLNGNPLGSSQSILPTEDTTTDPAYVIFTFYRRNESKDDTTQIFQYNSDLSTTWNLIPIPATTNVDVTITADSGATGIDKVEVKVAKAGNPKLFGRLKVSK